MFGFFTSDSTSRFLFRFPDLPTRFLLTNHLTFPAGSLSSNIRCRSRNMSLKGGLSSALSCQQNSIILNLTEINRKMCNNYKVLLQLLSDPLNTIHLNTWNNCSVSANNVKWYCFPHLNISPFFRYEVLSRQRRKC